LKNTTNEKCWECNGTLQRVTVTETYDVHRLGQTVIANIPMFRCCSCGAEVIGAEGGAYIDDTIEREYKKRGLQRQYRTRTGTVVE
jgi:YgiT-type zinc finger domain-containing protein